MKNAIVEKLRPVLSAAVDSEYKVVYILAESRKILETHPINPEPFALKLYCHWALHVDLDHPKTTRPFLEQVEKYVVSVLAGNQDIPLENRVLREFVFLETFRQQFAGFLRTHGLPTEVCDDDDRWHEFLVHYAGVIEDGALSCSAKSQPLALVNKVVFTKGRAVQNHYTPFGLAWTIFLVDGRNLKVEARASAPNGREMISWVVTLN